MYRTRVHTLHPERDLGCSELGRNDVLSGSGNAVLSYSFVLKCRSDPPPSLFRLLTVTQYASTDYGRCEYVYSVFTPTPRTVGPNMMSGTHAPNK